MILTETSVFTINDSTTHPDCSTMSTDRCLNTSRQTDPSLAADRGRHRSPGRLTRYVLALLVALSVLPAAAQDQDTTAPALSSVRINGRQLDLIYDEELDDDSDPDNSAFAITVNGASRGVLAIAVTRTAVVVILYSPVQAGETVTVSYTVPATNPIQDLSGNRAAAITNLTVSDNTPATVPPAPTNLTAQAGNAQVTLTWTTPGNGGSTITKHQYREKIESGLFGNWMDISNSAEGQTNANSYPVPDLTNGITYTFEVRAVNAQGQSTESNEDSTRPTAPVTTTAPPAPTNLTAQASDRSVTLTWTTPGNGGSAITKHQYQEKVGSGTFGNWTNIPNSAEGQANANSYPVPDLTNGITYTYQVRAVNAKGQSTESNEDSATPSLSPMTVTWPEDIKGTQHSSIWTSLTSTPPNPPQISVSGGQPYYTYNIDPNGAPDGLEIDRLGTITGTPTGHGDFIVRVVVQDDGGQGQSVSHNLNITIRPALNVMSIAYKTVEQGKRITPIHLSASGGWDPYTYSISGAPSGISLSDDTSSDNDYNDLITGSPSQDGTFPIIVTVTDDHGNTADHSFNMSVYSKELAKKFSPILILTKNLTQPDRKVIFPEPVEIMGAKSVSNLKFRINNVLGQELSDRFYSALTSSWRDYLNSIYQNTINNSINLSENKFAFLPAALRYQGRPPGLADGIYFVLAYFDYPGEQETGENSWYDYYTGTTDPPHPQAGANFSNTAYVHIFDKGDGNVVIQYYYFYPFNDFQNNHEGDWPRINVIVDSFDPDDAELVGIDYTFHGKGLTYTSTDDRIFNPQTRFVAPAEDGTHPVVYVGAGSHGGYPTGGTYPDPGGEIAGIGYDEDMTTDGLVLNTQVEDTRRDVAQSYDLIFLPNPDPDQPNMGLSSEMSWLGTTALWGTPRVDSPGDGPYAQFIREILDLIPGTLFDLPRDFNKAALGPVYSGWNTSGTSGYDKVNVPYTEFQQFPIVQNVTWSGTINLIGDIVVYPGATLTIDAGTVIRAAPNRDIHDMEDPNHIDIINYGTIDANGTSSQPIVFRSDTSTPSAGDWYGIRNHGNLTMSHCVIQHSVVGLDLQGTQTLTDMTLSNNTYNTPLEIAAIEDVTATQNVAITDILLSASASGGWAPYTYSTSDLPSGIVFDQNRVLITGTPTAVGDSDITVTVRDAVDSEASTTFNLFVSAVTPPLRVEPIADVVATQNVAITPIQVAASGGGGAYTYSIASDPSTGSGLSIDSNGRITGAPTLSGDFTIRVTVEDAPPVRAPPTQVSRSFSMTVNAPTPVSTLTIAEIDDIAVKISGVQTNNPITPIQVSVSGGQTPYTYALSSNPATGSGLSINATSGQITGTPTQRGTFTLSVTVTDNASTTANEGFSISVSLIADFNDDGVVNSSDYALFLEVFGLSEGDDGFNAEMDLNGDGTIGIPDFLILVDHWGSTARFF